MGGHLGNGRSNGDGVVPEESNILGEVRNIVEGLGWPELDGTESVGTDVTLAKHSAQTLHRVNVRYYYYSPG